MSHAYNINSGSAFYESLNRIINKPPRTLSPWCTSNELEFTLDKSAKGENNLYTQFSRLVHNYDKIYDKYSDLIYSKFPNEEATDKFRQRIIHRYGMHPGLIEDSEMPLCGTAFSLSHIFNFTPINTIEAWLNPTELTACAEAFNQNTLQPSTQSLQEEMVLLGINALLMMYPDYTEHYIFIPHEKATLHPDTNLPYLKSDTKSRELLLAYLWHKGILDDNNPEHNTLIEETFPISTQIRARSYEVQNQIEQGLKQFDNPFNINDYPKYAAPK